MLTANPIKPPLKSRNHTTTQYIGETFNHSYCRSEDPKKSKALYSHEQGLKSLPMPQLRFFEEVEIPNDGHYFYFLGGSQQLERTTMFIRRKNSFLKALRIRMNNKLSMNSTWLLENRYLRDLHN